MATYSSIAYDYSISGGGSLVLLQEQTASSSATISFTSGIDSTYKDYFFRFISIHPATDNSTFGFNGSDDTSSHSYDIIKTTTFARSAHEENDNTFNKGYQSDKDTTQGTGFQQLAQSLGADNDQSVSGYLHLFDPSSTTFVTHFNASANESHGGDWSMNNFIGGYFNTTAAITAIQFKMASGNIDTGTIKMYGIN